MANPSIDWTRMNDRWYSKTEVYQMEWRDMDLSRYMAACGPYGGRIAIIRDDKKLLKAHAGVSKPDIYIYSPAGVLCANVPWERGRLVAMGWSDAEDLVCVLEDGTVRLYDVNGDFIKTFSMGTDCRDVVDARFYGQGLAVLTATNRFFSVNGYQEPRPRRLADVPGLAGMDPPTAWTVLDPQFTPSRTVEVLVAVGKTVLVVDAADAQDQLLTSGPFVQMTVSPNGKLVAVFGASGHLWVHSTDFKRSFNEFNTKSRVAPLQLVWCGTDAVVAYWDKILLMVGPYGDWIKYTYEAMVHLVPEMDGVRIISPTQHEFLQRVPNVMEEIFRIGSTTPGALLHDAAEQFEAKSPRADDIIRNITDQLGSAVDACIAAAGHAWDPAAQRRLLKAASFGKCFLDYYNSDRFVDMCQHLRILHAVRFFKVGIPLTYVEYQRLGVDALIDRLIVRKQYALADRICDYLKLKRKRDDVLMHWACTKVRQVDDDDAICRAIVDKIGDARGVSFAEIARTAYKAGRPELATMLLDYEPRAADQVPLLLSMQEDELALVKAVESGDTDLAYLVLMHLRGKQSLGEFLRIVHKRPEAMDLLVRYCKSEDLELLKDFFYEDDRRQDSAILHALEAYRQTDLPDRLRELKLALGLYSEGKYHQFHAQATEEQIKLLSVQHELTQKSGKKYVDLPLSDTVYELVAIGAHKRAEQLRKDFRMSDRMFWWTKVRALADVGDWAEMERFSKTKKTPPIGFQPFVDQCIARSNKPEARKYIARLPLEERPKQYALIEDFKDAMEAAFAAKDPDALLVVRSIAGKSRKDVQANCDQLIAQLAQK